MKRWKIALAAAGAAVAIATAGMTTMTALAVDTPTDDAPPAVVHCAQHTAAMDFMHEAMGGDAYHAQMNGAGMMNGVNPKVRR